MNTSVQHSRPLRRAGFHTAVRRAVLFLLLACVLLNAAPAARAGEIHEIHQVMSDAWLLMDAQTGQLLAAKNPEKTKYPASITKILTLALTLKYGNLDDTLTVSREAVALEYNTSHIALQPGEVIHVRDAAMATLLASANDAANCLAEYVSGSMEAFAELMNRTVQEIGCTGTHFVNANGLPDDNHYTTALDMARITAWALTVPGFRELFSETFYTMEPTNKQPEKRSWGTQNAMLVTSAFQAEGAWGGKLGWTEEARHTMVTTLTRHGRDLILVTMDCQKKSQKYWDGLCILEACEAQLQPLTLEDERSAPVPVYDEGVFLGDVSYALPQLAVWVPAGCTADQLTLRWQLPEKLTPEDRTRALLTVEVPQGPDWSLPQRTLTLEIAQERSPALLAAWKALRAQEDGSTDWLQTQRTAGSARLWRGTAIGLGCFFGFIFLMFCIRWYNLARRNLRRYGTILRPRRQTAARRRPAQTAPAAQNRVTLRISDDPPRRAPAPPQLRDVPIHRR